LARLRQALGEHPLVGEIRGRGLLLGVELDADRNSRKPFADPQFVGGLLGKACFEERLLLRGGHGRVVAAIAPPLVLTRSDADEIVVRLGRALDRVVDRLEESGVMP